MTSILSRSFLITRTTRLPSKRSAGLVDRFDVEGRKIMVLAAPGDRRDEDIREIAEIAAGHFDYYICRRDDNPRGRKPDEIPVMLKDKLLEEGIQSDAIEVITDEQEATTRALELANSGDLVLVLGDNVKRTWKQIIYFNSGAHVEETGTKLPVTIELPETDDFALGGDLEIISDERGVRIAREDAD